MCWTIAGMQRRTRLPGIVALTDLFDFTDAVRSVSQGRASASMTPAGYRPAPDRLTATRPPGARPTFLTYTVASSWVRITRPVSQRSSTDVLRPDVSAGEDIDVVKVL